MKKLDKEIQNSKNTNERVVKNFGDEWEKYKQDKLTEKEQNKLFENYFAKFPWNIIDHNSIGFDLGCGSGRWSKLVATRVKTLYCIDPSKKAIIVAKKNLKNLKNCKLYCASVDLIPVEDHSMDFGYSLGVLHHIPNPLEGIKSCVRKLKPGAPFLIYLYYNLEDRPFWYQLIWRMADIVRLISSRLPKTLRFIFSQIVTLLIYYPLTRTALFFEFLGFNVDIFPLSFYRNYSYYVMQTDALDRFGTIVEHRYSKKEIMDMMKSADLERIDFNTKAPYWCAVGYRKKI